MADAHPDAYLPARRSRASRSATNCLVTNELTHHHPLFTIYLRRATRNAVAGIDNAETVRQAKIEVAVILCDPAVCRGSREPGSGPSRPLAKPVRRSDQRPTREAPGGIRRYRWLSSPALTDHILYPGASSLEASPRRTQLGQTHLRR